MTTALLAEPETGFRPLQLKSSLLDALRHAKYTSPTPIQAELIPHALDGRDVIGQAQTGTGKTAAFLLPFLNGWTENDGPGPQRWCSARPANWPCKSTRKPANCRPSPECRCVPIYGGTRIGGQLTALKKGANIVVGTPGRVIDHLSRGTLRLDKVRYVVLDEADRMLDIGFRPDIERILRRCPTDRQTFLLSATVPGPGPAAGPAVHEGPDQHQPVAGAADGRARSSSRSTPSTSTTSSTCCCGCW